MCSSERAFAMILDGGLLAVERCLRYRYYRRLGVSFGAFMR